MAELHEIRSAVPPALTLYDHPMTTYTTVIPPAPLKTAVLLLVFNRPELTDQVFEAIRQARPQKLYVAADGPRSNRPGEAELCTEVRRIATNVDWPCEVKTLFRESNLGCKMAVSGGINWFFENEVEGVILEDDVLPVPTFFSYCDQLLERYRNDHRVGMVSGCNLVSSRFTPDHSYFFSRYNHIWGWASWRRAWQHYHVDIPDWPKWRDGGGLKSKASGNRSFEKYWRRIFDAVYRGEIDTWDYQWTYSCWKNNLLTALPAANQTHNLGFGVDATHTTSDIPAFILASPPIELSLPLSHPTLIGCDKRIEQLIDRHVFGISLVNELRTTIRHHRLVAPLIRRAKLLVKNVRR